MDGVEGDVIDLYVDDVSRSKAIPLEDDSGGPLVCEDDRGGKKLFGVVRGGVVEENYVSCPRVESFLGWIENEQSGERVGPS